MAVPSGYVWAREIDPNAIWDPEKRTVTVAGRTYQPGEYVLYNDRAYIPSPVPEGYRWTRSYFAPGQVDYDPTTQTVILPGGVKVPQSQLLTYGDRTFVTPQQLAAIYSTAAAAYQPPQPTAEDVRRKSEVLAAIYEPALRTAREKLNLGVENIQRAAEAQKRLAEAAWDEALSRLAKRERESLRGVSHSVAGKNLGTSPLAEYQRRKVQEAYAEQEASLEKQRSAQLASIAQNAMAAANELAMKGKELEAEWASKIAEYAYNALSKEADYQRQALTNLANYFSSLYAGEQQAKSEAAKLAWEKEKAYLPYLYPTANELVPYTYGPTPYQQQSLAIQQQRAAASAARASAPSAAEQRALIGGVYADIVKSMVDKAWSKGGWAGAVEAAPVMESLIYSWGSELKKSGLDYQDLIDYLYSLIGGYAKKDGKWVLENAAGEEAKGMLLPQEVLATP